MRRSTPPPTARPRQPASMALLPVTQCSGPMKSWLAPESSPSPPRFRGRCFSKTRSSFATQTLDEVGIFGDRDPVIHFCCIINQSEAALYISVMGVKGKRVHIIEEISDTVVSFQKGRCHGIVLSESDTF